MNVFDNDTTFEMRQTGMNSLRNDNGAVGRVLWRAVDDEAFRRRTFSNLGLALAEFGFILTDAEMAAVRDLWSSFDTKNERSAYQRIMAAARRYTR